MGEERFHRVADRVVHRGHVFDVSVATFRDAHDGATFDRDVIRHPGAVGVVPVHDDGTVTLVRQFRPALGHDLLEIPAGLRDVDGEPPVETAVRELAEEVGLAADTVEPLTTIHNAAGYADETIDLFVATGLRSVERDTQSPEEDAMVVERWALTDLVAGVRDGTVTDVKTVVAVLLLARDA